MIVGFAAIVVLSALAIGMPATATDQIPAAAKRSPLSLRTSHPKRDLPRARAGREETAIHDENNRAGSTGWQIANGDLKPRPIEGFADRVSGQLGDRVRLFVTTRAPSFEVLAYRTGWYGGIGARLIWRSGPVPGRAQPRCAVLTKTRTVDCSNWAPSLSIKIGPQWIPGQYLFKLVQSDGSSSFVPLIVRNDHSHAAIVVIAAVTTIEAYNSWGGYSLYGDQSGDRRLRSTVVSFDRPFGGWADAGFVLGDTFEVAQMLEAEGQDVSYVTDVDVHEHPELLGNHHEVISGAHDEYYSRAMRNGLQTARDHGVNIVFLGANAIYRRIRFEPSRLGPDRREVNYRSATLDPLAKLAPEEVTTNWGDPPDAQPARSLTGANYECNRRGLSVDMVIVDADAWMFRGTHVTAGEHFPDMVRDEYDRVSRSPSTPADIEILSHSPLRCGGRASWSDMAYYSTPSGAGVIDVGTLLFEPHLGALCAPATLNALHWECQLRQAISNVVTAFAQGPAGRRYPARPNLDRFRIPSQPSTLQPDE